MNILEANSQHAKVIVQKVAELIEELGGKPFVYNEAEIFCFIDDAMEKGIYLAFLAINNTKKVVGILTMGESGAVYAGGKFGVIHEFYIDPEIRSQGIGKLLLEKAKQKSLDLNWNRLEVGAPPSPAWDRTKDFYLREGFQEIGPRLKWLAEPQHAGRLVLRTRG
jgi:GNAT superfamily N-acetyltransferase